MALFKPFHGPEKLLNQVEPKEGYAYFTDESNMFVDIKDEGSDTVTRHQLNAYAAQVIKDSNGDEYNMDDLATKEECATKTTTNIVIKTTDWNDLSYTYANTSITEVNPPLIYCVDNQDDFDKITKATVTAGSGITFLISEAPSADITISIVYLK